MCGFSSLILIWTGAAHGIWVLVHSNVWLLVTHLDLDWGCTRQCVIWNLLWAVDIALQVILGFHFCFCAAEVQRFLQLCHAFVLSHLIVSNAGPATRTETHATNELESGSVVAHATVALTDAIFVVGIPGRGLRSVLFV